MNTYKLVSEMDSIDETELDSDNREEALEEALEMLGYRVVIARGEEEVPEVV